MEVTFDIDADGILHVTAKDKATGTEQKVRVEASSGLEPADIDKAIKEAESHAEDDEKRREQIETKNTLDAFIYQTEKSFKEHGEKLEAEERQNLDTAIADAKTALEADDLDKMKAAQENLQNVAYRLSEVLYKNAAEAGAPEAGAEAHTADEEPSDDDSVIDVEEVST